MATRMKQCLWLSSVIPFVLKLPLVYWLVVVVVCVCLFWLLHPIHTVLRCVDQGETYRQIASHLHK